MWQRQGGNRSQAPVQQQQRLALVPGVGQRQGRVEEARPRASPGHRAWAYWAWAWAWAWGWACACAWARG